MIESVERKIPLEAIASISISELQDDILVLHIPTEWDAVLETVFKTELLTLLAEKYKAVARKNLQINFGNQLVLLNELCYAVEPCNTNTVNTNFQ